VATSSQHVSVLIAAPVGDVHGDIVALALAQRSVPVVRLTAEMFAAARVSWQPGAPFTFAVEGARWLVNDQTTVWWRRPGAAMADNMSELEVRLVVEEVAVMFPGILEAVGVRWVDTPWHLLRARLKPVQLAAACQVGLAVPRTIVTGDAIDAKKFAGSDAVIAKAASTGRGIAPHVAVIPDAQFNLLETCPTTLQHPVDAVADVRIVTVGNRAFGWRRPRPAGGSVDWRADDPHGADFVASSDVAFPEAVTLASALGLSFSVQDWLQTTDGPLFLEVNPQGQWLFLHDADRILVPAVAAHLGCLDD
jgi:glutathione synthase/RimK-type ligase-like ATP-grasp enzyme